MEVLSAKTLSDSYLGDNLSIGRVLLLIFIPPAILMLAYFLFGESVQNSIPSLMLFFLLAMFILFPIQIVVILLASKHEYGSYSLKSAFANHQKLEWWKIFLYGSLLFGFAGLMTVTVGPLEDMLFAPLAYQLWGIIPPYYDWTNLEVLRQFPGNVLLLTSIGYLILNGFIGPIVEELFFRGYLTSKVSRFGDYAPLIVTVLFSLYHFWLPFNNIFRIFAFFPASYLAWKKKNIYIAIVFHCMSNVFSSIGFFVWVYPMIN
jgi:uncharacterized protein